MNKILIFGLMVSTGLDASIALRSTRLLSRSSIRALSSYPGNLHPELWDAAKKGDIFALGEYLHRDASYVFMRDAKGYRVFHHAISERSRGDGNRYG